jgi:hypothetical protein
VSSIKRRSRAGRPRRKGLRTASGRLKQTGDVRAPTLWRRIKDDGIKLGLDRRLGSEIGRLALHGELTDTEATTAFLVAEIYGRYERGEGTRRSARSPSYEIGHGADHGETGDQERRARRARKQFARLQACLPAFPPRPRAILELLCCEDRRINSLELPEIRRLLHVVAVEFGVATGLVPSTRRQKAHVHRAPDAKPAAGAHRSDPQAAADRAETTKRLEDRQRREP